MKNIFNHDQYDKLLTGQLNNPPPKVVPAPSLDNSKNPKLNPMRIKDVALNFANSLAPPVQPDTNSPPTHDSYNMFLENILNSPANQKSPLIDKLLGAVHK